LDQFFVIFTSNCGLLLPITAKFPCPLFLKLVLIVESNLALYAVGQMIGFSVDENGRKFMYSGDFSLDSIKVSG
jgi:hypothetical protein